MRDLTDWFLVHSGSLISFLLDSLGHAWPYLLASIALALAVPRLGLDQYIKRVMSQRSWVAVVGATALGAFSPLCSVTVIPLVHGLLKGGIPLGPIMAFWLASPSMDPEIFMLTVNTLGWPLATSRLVGAAVLSLGGGFLAQGLQSRGFFSQGLLKQNLPIQDDNKGSCPGSPCSPKDAPSCQASPCPPQESTRCTASGPLGLQDLWYDLRRTLIFVGGFILFAWTLEYFIVLLVPPTWVAMSLGNDAPWALGLAVALGLPFYTTNAQALGLVGGLVQQGMGAGPAIGFLLAGATTTIPALTAAGTLARPRVLAVYLVTTVVGALGLGFLAGLGLW